MVLILKTFGKSVLYFFYFQYLLKWILKALINSLGKFYDVYR